MSTQPLKKSAEYAAEAEKIVRGVLSRKNEGPMYGATFAAAAQVYATLAVAAATVEAGSQVSDVGPALADVARELRDGLDAIARAVGAS